MKVGIIGGGITGLTAAFYLQRAGIETTLFETAPTPGGLARTFDFGPFQWDKFYHVILTSDHDLLRLLDDLKLTHELRWKETKTGFYSQKGLHSVSNTMEFLRFPPLSLWEKFRFALGIMYAARLRDTRFLEETPVGDWLQNVFGRGNYEKMWKPLLSCKLGAARKETSAAFIWGYISRYYSTRDKGASKKEMMGYVRGSYRTVLARLVELLEKRGTQFLMGREVTGIEACSPGKVRVRAGDASWDFDRVVFTGPSHILARLAPGLDLGYVKKLQNAKYLGVVCAALLLKRPLSPYYVTNLIDSSLPFTGVIETSALVSPGELGGRHLVYLPKYTVPGDPITSLSDAEFWQVMRRGLEQMHPDLREEDIEKVFVFRERYVQPIPVLRYSRNVPSMETNVPGLFLANSTFIINNTLSNNQMVGIARRVVEKILRADCPEMATAALGPEEERASRVSSGSISRAPGETTFEFGSMT